MHQDGFIYKIILNRQTFCNVDLTELVLDLIWSPHDSSVEPFFFIGGSLLAIMEPLINICEFEVFMSFSNHLQHFQVSPSAVSV